jgi:hypothetical protein
MELYRYGGLIESASMTLVFLSAILATGAGRKTLAGVAALVLAAVAGKWLHYFHPESANPVFYQTLGMIIVGYTAYRLLRFILRSPRVDSEVLCAGVAIYLTLGLLWCLAYTLVDQIAPGSFSYLGKPMSEHSMVGFTALYFSFATLCTVGYGDIMPVSGIARMLAIVEAGFGVLYMAILISRLVSLHASESFNRSKDDHGRHDLGSPHNDQGRK